MSSCQRASAPALWTRRVARRSASGRGALVRVVPDPRPRREESGMESDESLRDELLAEVEAVAPILTEHAPQSEKLGRLDEPTVEALRKTRLLRFGCPRELGGYEADPVTAMEVLEAVTRIDGSAGWTLGILALTGATEGSVGRLQLQSGREHKAGHQLPRGREDRRGGVEDSRSRRRDQEQVKSPKLVWQPDCGPDLAEFTRDLAPGCTGILSDVHLTKQAERHNAVGVSRMRGKAPHSGIGLAREWQGLPSFPKVCGAEHVPLFTRRGLSAPGKQHAGIIGLDRDATGIGQRPFPLDAQGLPGLTQIVAGKHFARCAGI